MKTMSIKQAIAIMLFSILLSACSTTSDNMRFYLLQPIAETSVSDKQPLIHLNVAPVSIPEYLKRPQLVSAKSSHEFELNEMHRWAEPLDKTLTRIIKQNIRTLSHQGIAVSLNQKRRNEADITTIIKVLDSYFAGLSGSLFRASWQHALKQNRHSRVYLFICKPDAANNSFSHQVKGLNQCVNELSQQVIDSISPFIDKP